MFTALFVLSLLTTAFSNCGSAHVAASDEEGPFHFDCNALEVKLSPRSREREVDMAASDATFEAMVTEVCISS